MLSFCLGIHVNEFILNASSSRSTSGKRSIFFANKKQFAKIPLLENLLVSPNPSFKTNLSYSVKSEND